LLLVTQENASLRAALDVSASQRSANASAASDSASPATHDAALQARVAQLQAQVKEQLQWLAAESHYPQVSEKQEHLEETSLLVEKMFSEFSALQGLLCCLAMLVAQAAHLPLWHWYQRSSNAIVFPLQLNFLL
jgi:hypothetical protein